VTTNYRLSRAARHDIDAIWEYSAQQWGDERAERYIAAIRNALDRINAGLVRPRSRPDVRDGYFGHTVGSHMLLMRKTRTGWEVVRILHQNMDFRRHLK
jgi:toxin ParE1/3/4